MSRRLRINALNITFSTLIFFLSGLLFFGDVAFAVGGDTPCQDTFSIRSPYSLTMAGCTSLCQSEGYVYGNTTTCESESACRCSGVASAGTGGSSGASATVRTRTSTGAEKLECPFSAFLEGPKDANACGMACGQSNYKESLFQYNGFSNDTTGAKKCCCTEKRGVGSAAGKGTFGPDVANPFGEVYDIPMLVGKTLRSFMGILGVIALVIFIYGGFLWMISLGDETRVKRGRETMIWAGMGLIAIVGSYVVIQFILETVLKPPQPITSTSSPPSTAGSVSSSSGGAGTSGTGSGISTGTSGTSSGSGWSGSVGGSAGGSSDTSSSGSTGSASGSSGSVGSGGAGTSGTGSGASTGTSGGGSGSSGGGLVPNFAFYAPTQSTASSVPVSPVGS